MNDYLLAVYSLWSREIVRFYRQRSRIIGALGTPMVFWFFIGSGFGSSFQTGSGEGQDYLTYFYPGTVLLVVLFTAIFSTFSLIEDRKEGFLQSVLVAPVSRSAIVLGKVLGGASIAFIQGVLFLLIAPLVGVAEWSGLLLASVIIFVNAIALTSLGFAIAWKVNSIQGFHVVMNLLLMPCWFLSGALFPLDGAPQWIRLLMQMNPLTYGLASLRRVLSLDDTVYTHLPALDISLAGVFLFGLVFFVIATLLAKQRPTESIV